MIAAIAVMCALAPVAATAAPTPDPETLKAALAEPPSSDYVEADSTVKGEGPMDAATYASIVADDPSKQQRIVTGLTSHGFVAAYGRLWLKKGVDVALVEQILAFNGNASALSYEGGSKLADTTSASYVAPIDSTGVPDSYGGEESGGGVKTTAIAFVKGNDFILVGLVSGKDYLVSDATAQAQAAYSHAPDYTIQPVSAPAIDTHSAAFQAGRIMGFVVVALLVLGLIGLGVGLVLRGRRRPAVAFAATALPFNLSGDGRYWWDGAGWQDAAVAAPPSAQRSPDGAFWWDGRSWRPVPTSAGAPL